MKFSRRKLEIIRWTSAALAVGAFASLQMDYENRFVGPALVFLGALIGLPAAMLTLHLHPPKLFKYLERRR